MPMTRVFLPARTRTVVGNVADAPSLGSVWANPSATWAAVQAGSFSRPSRRTASAPPPLRNAGGGASCARANGAAPLISVARTTHTRRPDLRTRAPFTSTGLHVCRSRERIRERVLAGLQRARAQGKRLGRPRNRPVTLVIPGGSVRAAARSWGVSKTTAARWITEGRSSSLPDTEKGIE